MRGIVLIEFVGFLGFFELMEQGRGGIGFNKFIMFLGFIGLMTRKRVEGSIPTTLNNTINPKNTMNKATKFVEFEGG